MKSIALLLLLFTCLLAVIHAGSGKIIINGRCQDCKGPDGKPLDEAPFEVLEPKGKSGAVTQKLTSGAVTFGLLYYSIGSILRNFVY